MAPKAESYEKTSKARDNIIRGNHPQSQAGVLTFVGLRGLDPFLQYGILAKGYGSSIITTLGGSILPQGPALVTNSPLDGFGLSPYRTILLSMAIGSMVKQNLYMVGISNERMEPRFAAEVGLFNSVFNSVNDLLFVCAQTSASANGQTFPQTPLLVGVSLFTIGMGLELGSEVQRHFFKKDPKNKGKVYEGGLFGLSRHINYFGYTLWRTGYAVAGGGWVWGAVTAAFFTSAFIGKSIPVLQHYLEDKVRSNALL